MLLQGWAGSWLPRAKPGLSCIPQTGRLLRVPGSCSTRARGAKAEPHPPCPNPENQPRHERRRRSPGSGGKVTVHIPPRTHTPLSFKGRGPGTPQISPRAVPVSRQSMGPFSPPFPGCTWDLTGFRVLPGAPLPLPGGSSESAPVHTGQGQGLSRNQSEASEGSKLTLKRPYKGEA